MSVWKKVAMSEFLTERKGRFKPNDPEIINYKRLDKIDFRGNIHISEKPSRTDMILIKPGDLVISGINVSKGALSVYEGDEPICATIHFSSYLFDNDKIDIDFLKRFLKSPSFQLELQNQVKGGIKTEIKPKHLLPLKVRIPDLSEQKKINKYFDSLDNELLELSNENDHQSSLLVKLRQSILQDAIEGKLTADWRIKNPDVEPARELLKRIKVEKLNSSDPSGWGKKEKPLPLIKPEEIPFEIPKSWVWCRLGEIMNVKSGKRIHAADYRKEGVPFLRSGEIGVLGRGEKLKSQLCISKEKYEDIKTKFGIPKEGDILIACIGGSIGNTWVVDDRKFYYKDGNLVLIESIPKVETTFLLTYLKSPSFWKNTILNATDSSYNALTIEKLKDAEFPLPSLAEQQAIVAKVETLLSIVDELESQVKNRKEQAKDLIQAVLREAFEGGE